MAGFSLKERTEESVARGSLGRFIIWNLFGREGKMNQRI